MKRGLSLLEVILSLAILGGTLAVLGEVARIGIRNAEIARDLTMAQLLCESKMAEITSGAASAEPTSGWVPFDTVVEANGSESRWVYSIGQEPSEEEDMVVLRVAVTQDPPGRRPVTFALDRWMLAEDEK